MSVEAVLDTNVLLYALSKADDDLAKAVKARELMREVDFGVSLQVLQEFYNATRKKARLCIGAWEAEALIAALLRRPWMATTPQIFEEARKLAERRGIGYWDAAILATAAAQGADILYSEDLNDGQEYGGVRVVNPFHGLP